MIEEKIKKREKRMKKLLFGHGRKNQFSLSWNIGAHYFCVITWMLCMLKKMFAKVLLAHC